MRQGQQNRRGRGRHSGGGSGGGNNNRKHQNPLTRSFDSNGPDQKIRGTPAHIAEKYVSLARDALSAGDPVLAENYLQHAEHYNRIIMAYREQQAELQQQQQNQPRPRHGDDNRGDDNRDAQDAGSSSDQPRFNGSETNGSGRANGNGYAGGANADGGDFTEQQASDARSESNDDADGDAEAVQKAPRTRAPRPRRAPRSRAPRVAEDGGDGDVDQQQPEFLTKPIRRPRRASSDDAGEGTKDTEVATVVDDGGAE